MIDSKPPVLIQSSRHCMAGWSGSSSLYLRFTEPITMSSPRGMARVMKALSRGLLSGEPSARFGGSMTVKLLSPTEAWTPAKSASAVNQFQTTDEPGQIAFGVGPQGGNARIDYDVVVGQFSAGLSGFGDEELGRLVCLLSRVAGARLAVNHLLRYQQERLERPDGEQVEHLGAALARWS